MWLHFLAFHHQKQAASALKGTCFPVLKSFTWNGSLTDILASFIHKPETAYWGYEKWGKVSYSLHLWRSALGFGSSITMSSRQGLQSPEVILLSRGVGGQRVLGFCCFFVYIWNPGAALMWGRLMPCLFNQKKIRKDERWRDGKRRNRGEREEKLEQREEVCFQVIQE